MKNLKFKQARLHKEVALAKNAPLFQKAEKVEQAFDSLLSVIDELIEKVEVLQGE